MIKLVLIICPLLFLASCSELENQRNKVSFKKTKTYQLVEVDSYGFRRAYHGHDTLKGRALDAFMNRDPEPDEKYHTSDKHPMYSQLMNVGIIKNGNLSLSKLDTLPAHFIYQFSRNQCFKVKSRLLQDPKVVKTPSYELRFMHGEKTVLMDTLAFDWPPDVTFFKADLDKDGTEEILSIFRWYIMNGDNFDLKIYRLKNGQRD